MRFACHFAHPSSWPPRALRNISKRWCHGGITRSDISASLLSSKTADPRKRAKVIPTKILASGTHKTQTIGNVMVSCETEVSVGMFPPALRPACDSPPREAKKTWGS